MPKDLYTQVPALGKTSLSVDTSDHSSVNGSLSNSSTQKMAYSTPSQQPNGAMKKNKENTQSVAPGKTDRFNPPIAAAKVSQVSNAVAKMNKENTQSSAGGRSDKVYPISNGPSRIDSSTSKPVAPDKTAAPLKTPTKHYAASAVPSPTLLKKTPLSVDTLTQVVRSNSLKDYNQTTKKMRQYGTGKN